MEVNRVFKAMEKILWFGVTRIHDVNPIDHVGYIKQRKDTFKIDFVNSLIEQGFLKEFGDFGYAHNEQHYEYRLELLDKNTDDENLV